MIRITNFDVGQADCFLLHFETEIKVYINNEERRIYKYFNLLVDGAYANRNIEAKLKEELGKEKIQGIVITHIDSDHISGILSICKKKIAEIQDAFIIFNKYDESLISYNQAKRLAEELKSNFKDNLLLKSYAKNYSENINKEANRKRNVDQEIEVNLMSAGQRKKAKEIDKEIVNITILGPDESTLTKFMQNWHNYKDNALITNAASIVLLIEFHNKAILMPGDGYFINIEKVLSTIRLDKIDVIKASHHGSKENNKRLCEIAKKYNCKEILFTITGEKNENHPDKELVKALKNEAGARLFCSAQIIDDELKEYMEQKKDTELKEE